MEIVNGSQKNIEALSAVAADGKRVIVAMNSGTTEVQH